MIYALLRAIAGVALRWYYRDIQVVGLERVPMDRPLILVVNHPNALVDALLVGWIMPRRVTITAKSTLFANPLASRLLRHLGVVPLVRASDAVATAADARTSRNGASFGAVDATLAHRGCVLIFPEGLSHDDAALAPLKTGAARMALQAALGTAPDTTIVPIGLVFERKDAPRTRVLVQVGQPIVVRDWYEDPSRDGAPAEALTRDIGTRLLAVTLNYASTDDAARAMAVASMVAAVLGPVPAIGVVDRGLGTDAAIARRIETFHATFVSADDALRSHADQLLRRLDALQRDATAHDVLLADIGISLRPEAAARFTIREGWLLLLGLPVALWGRVNHWLPFRAARLTALRSVESAADPAMRTLVAGCAFVLLTYLAQTALIVARWGPHVGGAYLISLPIAADVNFILSDRMRRARQRAATYRQFRRDPQLQERLHLALDALRRDVLALNALAHGTAAARP